MSKEFISLDKNHSISIDTIENTAYFKINYLKVENYKTFLLLLKNCIEYMVNNKIEYIKQYINEEDKENFKKSTFIESMGIIIVKTHINDFVYELCDALGIKRI
jgi:hypothetical protein